MSVCNIYKAPVEGKPAFYTFSEYMNDLVVNINNDGMSVARPSKFLALKLDDLTDIHKFLYKYYDNACCILRDHEATESSNVDTSTTIADGIDYRDCLLGGLLKGLESFGVNEDTEMMLGDIDLFGDGTIDGMKYDEIICYMNPSSAPTTTWSAAGEVLSPQELNKSTYISGYKIIKDEAGNPIKDENDNPVISGGMIPGLTIDDYTAATLQDFPKCNFGTKAYSGSTWEFNTIIILYDIYLNQSEDSYRANIPLGIYINPNTITKYINNNDIYNQGTSYALRIAMRFATTYDGSIYTSDVDTFDDTRDITSLVAVADRMSKSIDTMMLMANKFNEYTQITRDMMTAAINSSSGIGWRGYDDGRTY